MGNSAKAINRAHEANLKEIADEQEKEYQELYRPINRELVASVDDTSIVDAAKESAGAAFDQARGRTSRQLSRFNVMPDALAQREFTHSLAGSRALNYTGNVNNATLSQFERNQRMQDAMIDVGKGVQSSALANAQGAAASSNAIMNQNSQIAAQNTAARNQMIGSTVGTVAMIALMM